ncbi:MAG: hypothetical protein NVS3B20_15900 [Polyangiales bacterium]
MLADASAEKSAEGSADPSIEDDDMMVGENSDIDDPKVAAKAHSRGTSQARKKRRVKAVL